MKEDYRFVVGGAAAGAILGALGGWLYSRFVAKPSDKPARQLDGRQLMRLGGGIAGIIRQLLEL